MTQNSSKSRPSTASDTATKKSRWFRLAPRPPVFAVDGLFDFYWGGPERRISKLTVRIIGINAAALLMLLVGIIYLGQYQNTLIENNLRTFKGEVELISAALADAMNEQNTDPGYAAAKRMAWRFSHIMNQRIYIFDKNGVILADSDKLSGYGSIERFEQDYQRQPYPFQVLKNMAKFILKVLPSRRTLPAYHEIESGRAGDYTDAADALKGSISMSAWEKNNGVVLVAAAPVLDNGQIRGAVMLTREGADIASDIGEVWMNILIAFAFTLIITTLLSIYLSNVITTPLRQLANAADSVRRGKSKDTEIPDLGDRKDEIGELSIVMREMTRALWDRMDSIERFAADVAHELKNPLTSLRSAVETVSIVKKDNDREKLLGIIKDDVERMDRLITDISSASRLDSELSREALEPVDLEAVLQSLVETYQNPLVGMNKKTRIMLDCPGRKTIFVWGLEGRIHQVLDNLITNAISFSPENGEVIIRARQSRKTVIITIEDHGPGIPENKRETIFERFYTERPQHEVYGKHSGLGLSICRQIVTALGGKTFAENVKDKSGKTTGARFTVILNAV